MFPSEQYIQECIEHQKELREAAVGLESGDWVKRKSDGHTCLVVEADLEIERLALYEGYGLPLAYDDTLHWRDRYIPLFQPRQIIEMLEERGYHFVLGGGSGEHTADVFRGIEEPKIIKAPDPATALLKCLLEVIGKEK